MCGIADVLAVKAARSVVERVRAFGQSDFGGRVIWFTLLSAFERVMAVVQTVAISRALGITEYGVYGLLFGTIGFVASIIGLQMGLTATVFVSRYREVEKEKAAAVVSIVTRFGWAVAGAFVLLLAPFSERVSVVLLGSGEFQQATLVGIIFIGATIVSGVQDGVAQGFEMFGFLAKLKVLSSVLVLAAIYPVAVHFGLTSVLCAILGGLVFKFLLLRMAITAKRNLSGIPVVGSGVSFLSLVANFALPSMAVSLAVGLVTWVGMFVLSRQQTGFDGVAIANTGLQWRGPVLMLAASLGSVAVPAFSRMLAQDDAAGARKLRRMLLLMNIAAAAAVVVALIAGSGVIMRIYGEGFAEGRMVFSLIVLSTIPTVISNVYMQELVGAARMWRQLWLHIPFVTVMGASFLLLVPRYGADGYGWSLLLGSVIFLATVLATQLIEPSRSRMTAS